MSVIDNSSIPVVKPKLQIKVKLDKVDNSWKPSFMMDDDMDEFQGFKRKCMSILNKVTPKKYGILVEKFDSLLMDSKEKMNFCMELIFEKALNEPLFSASYARMCLVLGDKKATDENSNFVVTFKRLLIMKCQEEFEKDYMDGLDGEKYINDINKATTDDEKKIIKMEFDDLELKLRKRSLGLIRFICELYKLSILTTRIMHHCIRKLLFEYPSDEDKEALCVLLMNVGQVLDRETDHRLAKGVTAGLSNLTVYFNKMKNLVKNRKTSVKVRLMMLDVIELRQNGWRKEAAN